MVRLFLGLLFVLLDFPLEVGKMELDLVPDFVGWLLAMKGMQALAGKSDAFDRGRHWAFALSVAAALLGGCKLFAADALTRVWLWAAGLLLLAVTLGMLRLVRRGLAEMGISGERLKAMELILTVLLPICYAVGWVPMVGKLCQVAAAVVSGLYLLALYLEIKKSAE